MTEPTIVQSLPGIKRDGTVFEGDHYTGGKWCRFNSGKPRKIGGYRSVTDQPTSIIRGLHTISSGGNTYVHMGSSSKLEQLIIDNSTRVATGSLFDRTPAGFVIDADTTWQMDAMYNSTSTSVALIAHPSPNLTDLDSDTLRDIYYGDATSGAALTALGMTTCGGIVVLHPYLFVYCQGGLIKFSVPSDPTNIAGYNEARVASTKIIKGLPLRAGPGNAPAGLFWSLNTLVRAVFVGGSNIFQFDTVGAISVLSSHSIIEYDGVFYWIGADRFFRFNGTVQELPNDLNRTWFFKNLDLRQRQRVFGFVVPAWGEIWWCFPKSGSTECNHAIIYNVRLQTWYDTELPPNMRSYGTYADVLARPILADASPISGKVKLWVHESGWDEVDGGTTNPIDSYFETADMSLLTGQKPVNKSITCDIVEPDFEQIGQMYMQLLGRTNARSKTVEGPLKTFDEVAATTDQQLVKFKETHRQLRMRIGSNAVGGMYQLGQTLAHVAPSDGRMSGGIVS